MPTLLVDAGNTSIKCAYLDNGVTSGQRYYFYGSKQNPITLFKKVLMEELKDCTKVLMVSVLGTTFYQEALIVARTFSVLFASIESKRQLSGVTSAYYDSKKLGADRLVAMVAAHNIMNRKESNIKASIVIDSGTATTIDLIDSSGQHLGGLILPGLDLCKRSLLDSTKQLPNWGKNEQAIIPVLLATETSTAIHSGSIFGLSGAIDSICHKMEKELIKLSRNSRVEKIICGGNAKYLQPYLESQYLYKEALIMTGLNIISATEDIKWH